MSTHLVHVFLSLSLMAAAVYCHVAPTQPASYKSPISFSSSSSSSSSVVAPPRRGAVSDERQNFERTLLEYYKKRIVQQLGLNVSEDGAVIRPNGTSSKRPPVGSTDIISSDTPINISIDGKRGKPAGRAILLRYDLFIFVRIFDLFSPLLF